MNRCVPLLLVLTSVLACAPGIPPIAPDPERARTILTEPEIDAIAALLRFEDHRQWDSDAFVRRTVGASVEVRRRAAVAAGRIGDAAAVPFLLDLLAADGNPAVRADAAFALGLIGDTSATVVNALRAAAPREWAPVRPQETTVVVEAVAALGRLGSDRARLEVVDALRRVHPAPDPHSRRIAAEGLLAIWRFPTGPARASSALRFLEHPDPELRWRAALALVRLGLAEATPRLVAVADDPDPRVRSLVMRGIAAPLADSAGVTTTALAALSTGIDDPHPHVRINAIRALATFADLAPTDRLVRALRDEDPNVAYAAAEAVASLGVGATDSLLAFVLDDAAPLGPRTAALAGLAGLNPAAAGPIIVDWSDGGFEQRYAAARAAGAMGWGHGEATLIALAADGDPRVAVAATQAVAMLAADTTLQPDVRSGLRRLLRRAVTADDPRQRTVALRGLVPLVDADDLPVLRADPPAAAAAEDIAFYRDIVVRYVVPALAGRDRPMASIGTRHGDIRIELMAEEAPLTVHNFATLAGAGFYDDGVWHRVVPNFVLQDGAPAGDPSGGPGWTIRDEINRLRYERGVLGMALSGPDTGGSQWFITHSPQPHLDGGYTLFGRVVSGERAMDRVVQGEPVLTVRVTQ